MLKEQKLLQDICKKTLIGGDKMLNIIITAGGTSEKIDSVRKITNNSA